jgi:sugar-specific transcriptional regulator TrmB
MKKLSLERIFKALRNLGLSESEIRIYFYVATNGPAFARDIISNLPFKKRMVYRILKNLQTKGIVLTNSAKPSEYSALPFEDVLSILIKQKNKQAKVINERKEELVQHWKEHGR